MERKKHTAAVIFKGRCKCSRRDCNPNKHLFLWPSFIVCMTFRFFVFNAFNNVLSTFFSGKNFFPNAGEAVDHLHYLYFEGTISYRKSSCNLGRSMVIVHLGSVIAILSGSSYKCYG